ncbi:MULTISPECIES: GNAT family N-acetyltransferase [unclassified Streptomyces]|uniref:GNAT family N-acetyltransferase n=1 Tax=unclassified Streptomyces TaxID=2593676 RepID=UPI0016615AC5|nr:MULTISPECIES: GNAT family N-acetyltransferase [unclassified Streptomyces]MBD0709466.1 GNAT family N-acetyltransferase [Streptomyces sp. CBMA291]MBD0713176.1 GNAT family N-acetyltransferase [Streptomyces sp. CBMA370]
MTTTQRPDSPRAATAADIDAVVRTLTTAFFHDPLWGPVFPDTERRAVQASAMWRLFARSALRYHWLLVSENAEAAAVWIPPGGEELTPEEARDLGHLLRRTAGQDVAEAVLTMGDRFAAARPRQPHFYLTLLGVHDLHRGKGLGMTLLARSLDRIDALGAPAYLESSNPANLRRYERLGFTALDEVVVATGHVVTTMWRRGAAPGPEDAR